MIVPLLRQHGRMLRRNLLYTAITRARRLVVLLTEPDALERAVRDTSDLRRTTLLRQRLSNTEPTGMTLHELDDQLAAATPDRPRGRRAGARLLPRPRQLAIEHKGQQDLVSIADRSGRGSAARAAGRGLSRATPSWARKAAAATVPRGPGCSTRSTAPSTSSRASRAGAWSRPWWSTAGSSSASPTIPVHDEMFTARRGGGALRNGAPVRVSGNQGVDTSCLALAYSFRQPTREPTWRWSTRRCSQGFEHRRCGSTAIQLCWVADGRCDAFVTQLLLLLGLPRRADPGRGGRRPGHRFRRRPRPARQRRRRRLHAGAGRRGRGTARTYPLRR